MWAKRYLFLCILGSLAAAPAASAGDDAQACLDAAFYEGLDPVIDICSRAIDAGTRDKDTLAAVTLKRGDGFYRAGRMTNALSDVEEALAIRADYPEALVLRANIYLRNQQFGPALRDAVRAINLRPDTRGGFLVLAMLARLPGGDPSRAILALQQELRNHPDF